MNEADRRQASLALRDLARAFRLEKEWPVVIRKPEGDTTIAAGELVRRIEKKYPDSAAI
jgi:hypothetical protein